MNFPSFKDYYSEIKNIENILNESETLNEFLQKLCDNNLNVNDILLSNFSYIINQHKFPKDVLYERAPKGKKAENFILANKTDFKKRYSKNWESVLYATAWKLFPEE